MNISLFLPFGVQIKRTNKQNMFAATADHTRYWPSD